MKNSDFDVIIVGAGAAGCVLANRLSSNPDLQILLIEAGNNGKGRTINIPIGYGRNFAHPKNNWMLKSSPDGSLNGEAQYQPRGKGLGGSTLINAMVYTRGFASDYDAWETESWKGEDFWRAHDEIENRHGEASISSKLNAPLDVSRLKDQFHRLDHSFAHSAQDLGLEEMDMVEPEAAGFGDYRFTIKKGKRVSSRSAFLDPIKSRPNLTVLTHAEVAKVTFENGEAREVIYRHKKRLKTVQAALVILASGAYNTPKILQNSGIGDAKALSNLGIEPVYNNPNVGQNLQDHVSISYHYSCIEPSLNSTLGKSWPRTRAAMRYALTRKGPFALSVNHMGAFLRSSPSRLTPDFQVYFNPISFDRNDSELRSKKYPSSEDGYILAFNSCRPTSLGRVDIASSNPFDDVIIRPKYLSSEEDKNDVLMGAQIIKAFERAAPLLKVTEGPMGIDLQDASANEIYEDFLERAGTVFHPCGTAKIASKMRGGVVDEALNVHGVKGLKVVDASVFPRIPSANLQGPVMALAWIAGERILNELKASPPPSA